MTEKDIYANMRKSRLQREAFAKKFEPLLVGTMPIIMTGALWWIGFSTPCTLENLFYGGPEIDKLSCAIHNTVIAYNAITLVVSYVQANSVEATAAAFFLLFLLIGLLMFSCILSSLFGNNRDD